MNQFKFFRGLTDVRATRRYYNPERDNRRNEVGPTTQPIELTPYFVELIRSRNIENLTRSLGMYHGLQKKIVENLITELNQE
jgi:hypothetical protein